METFFSEVSVEESEKKEKNHGAAKQNPVDHQSGLLNVKVSTLSLHKGPGLEYPELAALMKGDKLKFINFLGDWVFVKAISLNIKGWVTFKDVE